jgi:hypothetical protein
MIFHDPLSAAYRTKSRSLVKGSVIEGLLHVRVPLAEASLQPAKGGIVKQELEKAGEGDRTTRND